VHTWYQQDGWRYRDGWYLGQVGQYRGMEPVAGQGRGGTLSLTRSASHPGYRHSAVAAHGPWRHRSDLIM
jgi:hypothetical protein